MDSNLPKLVAYQKIAFDALIESVENNSGRLFFLNASGGIGKSFLVNLIVAKVRQSGRKAIALASSGIAATILSDVKTTPSTFKLPLAVSLEQRSV